MYAALNDQFRKAAEDSVYFLRPEAMAGALAESTASHFPSQSPMP